MRKPKVSVACIAVCGTLGVPGAALAQEPGVHFDPGSPAGKEYAIPLAEGRAEGAGTRNQRAAADVPFGVGINPPGGGDGRGGGGAGDRGGPGGGDPTGSGTIRSGGPAGSGTTSSDGPRGESGGATSSGGEARRTRGGADRRASDRPAADEQAVSNAEAPVDTTGRTIGIALLVLAAGAALGLLLWWRRGQPAA